MADVTYDNVEETILAEHLNQRSGSTMQFVHVRYRRGEGAPLCDSFAIRSVKPGRPIRDVTIGYRMIPHLIEALDAFSARLRRRHDGGAR